MNDLRVQPGAENFMAFLEFVEQRISGLEIIESTILLVHGRRAVKRKCS